MESMEIGQIGRDNFCRLTSQKVLCIHPWNFTQLIEIPQGAKMMWCESLSLIRQIDMELWTVILSCKNLWAYIDMLFCFYFDRWDDDHNQPSFCKEFTCSRLFVIHILVVFVKARRPCPLRVVEDCECWFRRSQCWQLLNNLSRARWRR